MIRIVRSLTLAVMLTAGSAHSHGLAQTKNSAGLPLSDLVRQVKVALLRVSEDSLNQGLPPLESVDLELKSTLRRSIDGKLNFYVVEVGANIGDEVASKVSLTLKPPKPDTPSDIAAANLSDVIAEAILAGSQAIAIASQGSPPLLADKLVAEVNFALKRDGDGKVGIDFAPVKIGVGGKIASESLQTIRITYAAPRPGR